MSKTRSVIAFLIAAYLLLVLYDRFVFVEALARRVGVALFLSFVDVAALVGAGLVVRSLLVLRFHPGVLDLSRELLLGYPVFGMICFLVGTLNVSSRKQIMPKAGYPRSSSRERSRSPG